MDKWQDAKAKLRKLSVGGCFLVVDEVSDTVWDLEKNILTMIMRNACSFFDSLLFFRFSPQIFIFSMFFWFLLMYKRLANLEVASNVLISLVTCFFFVQGHFRCCAKSVKDETRKWLHNFAFCTCFSMYFSWIISELPLVYLKMCHHLILGYVRYKVNGYKIDWSAN